MEAKMVVRNTYLRVEREIPSVPDLVVGDLLWKVAYEIVDGGYEVVVLRRRGDGRTFKVRVERLSDSFGLSEAEDAYRMRP